MKIRHNIKRTGSTLSGHILETIFEEGEGRRDCKEQYTEDNRFNIESYNFPQLHNNTLYVHGSYTPDDNEKVFYNYPSEPQAQIALNYINEFSVAEEPKIEYVYVSSESEENALQIKQKRILITKLPGKAFVPYICVVSGDEDKYIKGELYGPMLLQYAVPVPPDKKKLREIWMTDAEYEKFIY